MKIRTRSRLRKDSMGRITSPLSEADGPFPYTEFDAEITDYVDKTIRFDGTKPPSDLTFHTRKVVPPGLTYYKKHKTTNSKSVAYALPCGQPGAVGPFLTPPGGWSSIEPAEGEILSKGLSSSNPFRYEVSVPVMVAELVEATTLFRVQLATLHTAIGSSYLNTKFGWESLIGDIKTLTKILGAIESRLKEFNSLVKRGGTRRRVSISKESKSVGFSNRACFSSSQGTWYSYGNITYTSKVWLSVRWRPRRDKIVEVERLVQSRQALLKVLFGFERNRAVQAWEIIPFSWLIDYFVDVSSILQSLENVDLVEPYDICIMRTREASVRTEVIGKKRNDTFYGYSYGTVGTVEMKSRLRTAVSTDISTYTKLLSFGILTKEQALTILALLASRKRGS